MSHGVGIISWVWLFGFFGLNGSVLDEFLDRCGD